MDCREFEKLYWLRAYGEAIPGGEDGFLTHLKTCPRCQARKAEWDGLQSILGNRTSPVPKPEALARAREKLSVRLRSGEFHRERTSLWEGLLERLRWELKPAWQPALALGMLLVGILIGRIVFYAPVAETTKPPTLATQYPEELKRYFLAENVLEGASQIEDLRVRPLEPETGLVEVSFLGTKEYQIQGSPEDDLIRGLLSWAVKNEENSGARLQSVEELGRASHLSPKAREVLAYALIHDQNDGVRLKALEALSSAPRDPLSEQAILNALLKDPNPAVRIGAIDALLSEPIPEKSETLVLQLAEADSNDYVRMRARQAIRRSNFSFDMINLRR